MFKANPLQRINITSPFGLRTHPVTGEKNSFHSGIDLGAAVGTPVYAVDNGRVVVSKCNGGGPSVGYGYYIIIEHDGYCTLYAHLKELGLPAGVSVKAGDRIGFTGATGRVSGPHLHLEARATEYDAEFFNNEPDGRKHRAVDPSLLFDHRPRWERIVTEAVDMPGEWIDWIKFAMEKYGGMLKWFPQFIEKIYDAGKAS